MPFLSDARTEFRTLHRAWLRVHGLPDSHPQAWVREAKPLTPMSDDMLLPDVIIKSIMRATRRNDLAQQAYDKNIALLQANDPLTQIMSRRYDWEQTKNTVQAGISAFSDSLADKITFILSHQSLIMHQEGPANGICYSAVDSRPLGQICLSRDSTTNDPIYLSHEVGHMIANHFALEETHNFWQSMMPKNTAEIPAFVCQFMMYDYLSGQPDTNQDSIRHFINEVCHMVYEHQIASSPFDGYFPELGVGEELSYQQGKANLHAHRSQVIIAAGLYYSGAIQKPSVFDAVFKAGANTDVLKILEAASITDEAQLDNFFDFAVAKCLEPLLSPAFPPLNPSLAAQGVNALVFR